MGIIDTSTWKEFVVGKLFQVSRPTARKLSDYEEGNVPFIASGRFNNGVLAMLMPKNEDDIDKGNCLTVSPVDGYAFYQEYDFLGRGGAGSSIIILRNENLNKYNGQYIASVLRHLFSNWSYDNMGNKDIVKESIIKLPVRVDGKPDWEYMEAYMKDRDKEAIIFLNKLIDISKLKKTQITIDGWQEYRVGDLFDGFVKPEVYHTRQVVEDSGGIPYVVRSKFNNGIKYRVKKEEGMKTSPSGVISWGAENATFFYREEEWCSGRDIYYIDTRCINEYACYFLISCLMFVIDKYSYNWGLFPDLLKEEKIKLPSKNGEPDWKYMEEYMKKIEKRAKKNVNINMKK